MHNRRLAPLMLSCLCFLLLASPCWGERGPSLAQLRQTVIDNPRDPEANYQLGLKYEALGRSREALKYLQAAVQLRPDYADALNELQKIRAGRGEYGEAARYLEQLSKLKPDSLEIKDALSDAGNKQGLGLLREGKFADAAAAFTAAAQSSPKSPGPPNNLGIAQLEAGKTQEAIAAFQEAIHRDPRDVAAHYNLSLTYFAMGDKWKARMEFLSVRTLDPDMARELGTLVLPGIPQAPEAPPAPPFLPKSSGPGE